MKREVRPGETIGGLMTAVFLFALLFSLLRPQSEPLTDLLVLAIILLFLRWVVLPTWVVGRQRFTADAPIEAFDPEADETPEQVRSSIRVLIPKLDHLGFGLVGHPRQDNPGVRGRTYVTLFVNTPARQTARLFTVIVGNPQAPRVATSCYFRTDFTDGTRMITSNNKTARTTPQSPRTREGSISLPAFGDISVLYQIHEAAIARYASDGARVFPDMTDPASYLRSSINEECENWIEHRYYYLDEREHALRPTWKGAVIMGLRASFPSRWIREKLRRWRANRLLRELEIAT